MNEKRFAISAMALLLCGEVLGKTPAALKALEKATAVREKAPEQSAQNNAQPSSHFRRRIPRLWNVDTQHNYADRSGVQFHENILKPSNVTPGTFGRLYERHVEGQIITQPLYVVDHFIPGKGTFSIVYVATRKNWVYAFDADNTDPDPSHGLLWSVQVEPAGPVPNMCTETLGPMGITSTPVIDRASGTLYVVARNADGSIWLHALDLATGKDKSGTPGKVQLGQNLKNGSDKLPKFDQNLELSRAALLLQNGVLYIGFGALNCDNKFWRGWVLAYSTPDLKQVGAFATVAGASGEGGGVWQSGNGLVGDNQGNIYFQTGNFWNLAATGGNGPVQGKRDLGESIVKLQFGPNGLTLAGSYTVSNSTALNSGDTDLGSGGPILLPGGRLLGGGKQGKFYVLDTNTMQPTQNPPSGTTVPGGSDGFQAFVNSWHDDSGKVVCTGAPLLQRECYMPHDRYEQGEANGPNIHGGPIYWDQVTSSYGLIYGMAEKDYLSAFPYDLTTFKVDTTPMVRSEVRSPDGMPGSFLSLSASGNSDGIIWASIPKFDGQFQNVPGRLVAFDALTLKELWRDDDDIAFPKFTPPTIAGGRVFRPTFADKLIVYGLKNGPDTVPCYNIADKFQNYTGPDGLLGAATNSETVAPDGVGHFQHFANGASIYWTPSTCAFEVHGAIRGLWASLGWERSFLGYPVSDETITPDGIGRFNYFQGGGIYWTPLTGAHEVHGAILGQWAGMGWEHSSLGYPISDETDEVDGSGRFNLFEHGSIHWNRNSGAVTVNADSSILIGPVQGGVNRPGSDIANMPLPAANPVLCQQQCADNAQCRSWTYVNPGIQGPQAHCWLKGTMPLEQADNCCTSGIKVDVNPANIRATDGAVDRPGSDFANFDLPSADFRLCQGECAVNSSCSAYAYVEPDNTHAPHCWLKNAMPATVPNLCCVSGTK